jgi:hypothetical protein
MEMVTGVPLQHVHLPGDHLHQHVRLPGDHLHQRDHQMGHLVQRGNPLPIICHLPDPVRWDPEAVGAIAEEGVEVGALAEAEVEVEAEAEEDNECDTFNGPSN